MDEYLTPRDVARLGIMAPVTQWQARTHGLRSPRGEIVRLGHVRLGRKILYARRHIEEFLLAMEARAQGEEGERDAAA